MPTTTIEDGHAYITTGTISGNTITHNTNEIVDIWFTKLDYNYDNALQLITGFISKRDTGTEKPSRIIDLKRITESVNISGYLIDESGSSAKTKRNNLLKLGASVGVDQEDRELTLVWGTNNAADEQTILTPTSTKRGVFVQKMMFSETGGYVGETVDTTGSANPPERKIQVTIQLVRGKDI